MTIQSTEFNGFGRKYIEALENDYPEIKDRSEQDKISLIILGLMKNGLNKPSILEQLKDIDNIQEYHDRVEIALIKTLEG